MSTFTAFDQNNQSVFSVVTSAGAAANEIVLQVTNLSGADLPLTFWEGGQSVSNFSLLDVDNVNVSSDTFTITTAGDYTFRLVFDDNTDLNTVLGLSSVTGEGEAALDVPLSYDVSHSDEEAISFTITDQNMWGNFGQDTDMMVVGWHDYLPILGTDFMQWQADENGIYQWVDTSVDGDNYWYANASLLDLSVNLTVEDIYNAAIEEITSLNSAAQALFDQAEAAKDTVVGVLSGNIDDWADMADYIVTTYYAGGFNHQWEWATGHGLVSSADDPVWKLSKIIYMAFTQPVFSFFEDGIAVLMPDPCNLGADLWDGFSVAAAYAIEEKGYDLWTALKWAGSQLGMSSLEFDYSNAILADYSINLQDFFNAIVDVLDKGSSFLTDISNTLDDFGVDILNELAGWFGAGTLDSAYPTYLDALNFFDSLISDVIAASSAISDAAADLIQIPTPEELADLGASLDLSLDGSLYARVGLMIDLELDGGSVDTDVQYAFSSTTAYNQLTDMLTITPTLVNVTDGDVVAFSTASPNISFSVKLLYDVGAELDLDFDGELNLPGVTISLDGNPEGSFNFNPMISTSGTNLQFDFSGADVNLIQPLLSDLLGLLIDPDLGELLDFVDNANRSLNTSISIEMLDHIVPYDELFIFPESVDIEIPALPVDELTIVSLDTELDGGLSILDGLVSVSPDDLLSDRLSGIISGLTQGMIESLELNLPTILTDGTYLSREDLVALYEASDAYAVRHAIDSSYVASNLSIAQIINDYYYDEGLEAVNFEQLASIFTNATINLGDVISDLFATDWLQDWMIEHSAENPEALLADLIQNATSEFALNALDMLEGFLGGIGGSYETGSFVIVDMTQGGSDGLFHLNTLDFNSDDIINDPENPDSWSLLFEPYTDADITEDTASFGLYISSGDTGPVYRATMDVDSVAAFIIKQVLAALTAEIGQVIPPELTNPFDADLSLETLLRIVEVDGATAAQVQKYLDFQFEQEKLDYDISSFTDFSQEFTLTVDDMAFEVTFTETGETDADCVTLSFRASEADSLNILEASQYDTNHDGVIDYKVQIVPSAMFSNDTELGYNYGLSLDYLRTALSAAVNIPLSELFPGLPELTFTLFDYDIGPLLSIDAEINGLDIDIWESRFALDIGEDSVTGVFDVNVAPSFAAAATACADLPESVFSLMSPSFDDVDNDNLAGIVVTDNSVTAEEGVWEYSTDGSNWCEIGSVSETAGLLLSKDTLLRFTPVSEYAGEKHFLTVYAVDDSSDLIFTDSEAVHTYNTTADSATSMVSVTGELLGYQIDPTPGVNDAPSVDINSLSVLEGGAIRITASVLHETDPDDSGSALTYSIASAVAHGTLWLDTDKSGTLNGTENALTAGSTFTQQDIDNRIFMYAHDGSETTSDGFVFSLADDDGASVSNQQFEITVIPVDDQTILHSVAGSDPVTLAEDTPYTYTIVASDPDSPLSYSVETEPTHGTVIINATTGEYTYTPDADYHGTDSFSVGVVGNSAPVTETVILAVTSAQDDATGTVSINNDGGAVTASLTDVIDVDGAIIRTNFLWQRTYDGTSWDDLGGGEGDTTTFYAMGGTYRCVFTTEDVEGGITTFVTGSVTASYEDTASVINDPSSLPPSAPDNTLSITIAEDTSYTILLSAPVPTEEHNYDHYEFSPQHGVISGPVITPSGEYEYTYTPDQDFYGTDQFRIDLMELMPFTTADGQLLYVPAQTLYLTMTIENVEDEASGSATITGTAEEGGNLTASLADITDVDGTVTGTYQWQINNGSGWTNILSATTDTLAIPDSQSYVGSSVRVIAITTDTQGGTTEFISAERLIANVNDAPVITSFGGGETGTVVSTENRTVITAFSASDEDPDDTATFSITGGDDRDLFSIDVNSGILAFKNAPDYERPIDNGEDNSYQVIVTVTDGSGATDSQLLSVNVTNANEVPVITSSYGEDIVFLSSNENSSVVTTVIAVDPDSDSVLTYSISGGDDQALFQIDSSSGLLLFNTAPDYEIPEDSDGNNVYLVEVTATDTLGASATQSLSIHVTNVNEAPVIIRNTSEGFVTFNLYENSTVVTTVIASDQDITDTLIYSLSGGNDQTLFQIDSQTGVLVFSHAPDYENPADSDSNNTYEVQVMVTDGLLSDTLPVTVNVLDIDENPAVIPPGTNDPSSPDSDDDKDGVSLGEESAVPSLGEDGSATGDGNGDGIPDAQQADVTSVQFSEMDYFNSNGDPLQTYITLVADSSSGRINESDDNQASILYIGQIDAPDNLPEGALAPLGLIRFIVDVADAGQIETFSLYVDDALSINGYWKQTNSGDWVNLASEEYGGKIVYEEGMIRLDFQIEDGGVFDSDGVANGIISDPGAPAYFLHKIGDLTAEISSDSSAILTSFSIDPVLDPETLPGRFSEYAQSSMSAVSATSGAEVGLTLKISGTPELNGFWVPNEDSWINLATSIETIENETLIQIALTDNGAYDTNPDAQELSINGVLGVMPLTLLGAVPVNDDLQGVWF
nr:cadherin domain-containing protein [uncultured Desulfuromonas sp.]